MTLKKVFAASGVILCGFVAKADVPPTLRGGVMLNQGYDIGDAQDVAIAHWTGIGRRGDFADAANWACTNETGQALLNAVPGAEAVVYFHDNLDFDVTDAATFAAYKAVRLDVSFSLAGDCDWRGLTVNEPCLSGTTISLSGHAFKLTGVNGVSALAFTVTDAATPGGEFVVDVPTNATFENTLITLAGTVRLVKDGPGLFIPHRYGLDYTGGTHIAAGALRLFRNGLGNVFSPNTQDHLTPLGAKTSVVIVDAGATYDINGLYDAYIYPIVLNGGTLQNGMEQKEYDWGGLGGITLLQDSTMDFPVSTVFRNKGDWWTLNGHTLYVNLANGAHLFRKYISATNGTIAVTGNGILDVHGDAFNAPEVTLDCASEICANAQIAVSNYVSRYTGSKLTGLSRIEVSGVFKPMTDCFHYVTLHEGATLDLSGQTNAFDVVGRNGGTIAYATGTENVAIDIGSREPAAGEQLVKWTVGPENVAFSLCGVNVGPNDKLSVRENGIFYNLSQNPDGVLTATWTGKAGDGNFDNPENWLCQNAVGETIAGGLPQSYTIVTFTGSVGFDIPVGAAVPWQKVIVEKNVVLTRNCDWSGLGTLDTFIAAGAEIDLKGHRLFVSAPDATLSTACTFTDSTTDDTAPGELHLAVVSGTFINSGIVLAGNLRLVKEGAGTFVPAKYGQTYAGGNEITEGTLKLNNNTNPYSDYGMFLEAYCRPIGAEGKTVVIKEGGTLEMNGLYDLGDRYRFELAGGQITNNKKQLHPEYTSLGNVTLTADSTIVPTQDLSASMSFNLGGHELTVPIAVGGFFYVGGSGSKGQAYSNGTLRVSSGGTLQLDNPFTARDLNLDVKAAMVVNAAAVDLNDYTSRIPAGDWNGGSGTLRVHGTFTPVTECFYGCEMQDGSTLDLTEKTDVWNTTGTAAKGIKTVTFAAGARITVALGERDDFVFNGTGLNRMAKVMSWETPPDVTTRFVPDEASVKVNRRFVKRDDGLYLAGPGMVIMLR